MRRLLLDLFLGLAAAVWLVGASGCASQGFSSDVSVVHVTSSNVQGKNVYIPSTIVVTGNSDVKLSVYNTTDTPHGFAIDGLGIEVVLPPGVETEVPLPRLEGGRVYRIHCQLHPPHRDGTLVVLPGR